MRAVRLVSLLLQSMLLAAAAVLVPSLLALVGQTATGRRAGQELRQARRPRRPRVWDAAAAAGMPIPTQAGRAAMASSTSITLFQSLWRQEERLPMPTGISSIPSLRMGHSPSRPLLPWFSRPSWSVAVGRVAAILRVVAVRVVPFLQRHQLWLKATLSLSGQAERRRRRRRGA